MTTLDEKPSAQAENSKLVTYHPAKAESTENPNANNNNTQSHEEQRNNQPEDEVDVEEDEDFAQNATTAAAAAEAAAEEEVQDQEAEHEAEFVDEAAEKSTASPCSVPEPEHCSFRTPPPPPQQPQQHQQHQQSDPSCIVGGSDSLPQSELLGKLPQEEPQSATRSCSSSHSPASVEVERSCMETRGFVSVKWDITRKNKTSIVIDGYKMTESRAGKDGRVFWRCSKRFCSATAISLGQRLLSVRQVDARRFHNHPPTGKEEFFRGDYGSPGTQTQVTIKWPVTRLSVAGSCGGDGGASTPGVSEDALPAAAADQADPNGSGSPGASLSLKRSALLRRRREKRRHQQRQQEDDKQLTAPSVMSDEPPRQIVDTEEDAESSLLSGQYRDSSLLLGSSTSFAERQQPAPAAHKRARHESLEDVASIQQRLTDSLGGVAGLQPLGSAQGGVMMMDEGRGALQALASAASLHGNSSYSNAASSSVPSNCQPPMSSSLKSQPSVPGLGSLLQFQQQQQHGLDSQTQKALLALALSGFNTNQQQLQQLQQQPPPPPPPYNPIFNPPPTSQQPANLFSLAAASNSLSNGLSNNNNNNAYSDSPLKEALSQIDNSQLRRQLRRLEGYFRSGIVAMSEAIFRQQLQQQQQQQQSTSFGSKMPTGVEQDCLSRLFSYLEGLERVGKLTHELA